ERVEDGAQFVESGGAAGGIARRHDGGLGAGRRGRARRRRLNRRQPRHGGALRRCRGHHGRCNPARFRGRGRVGRRKIVVGALADRGIDASLAVEGEQVARGNSGMGHHAQPLSTAAIALAIVAFRQTWKKTAEEIDMAESSAREAMEFDVVIVGAGPSGLAAAIRLKQLSPDIGVVVVEKGSEVGAHILSGAVIDPVALDRLLPEWRGEETPIKTSVTADEFYWLGPTWSVRVPNFMMPPLMSNHGNFVVSLG